MRRVAGAVAMVFGVACTSLVAVAPASAAAPARAASATSSPAAVAADVPAPPTGVTITRTGTTVGLAWSEAATSNVPVVIRRLTRDHGDVAWQKQLIVLAAGQREWSETTPSAEEVRYDLARRSPLGLSDWTRVVVTAPAQTANASVLTGCRGNVCTYTLDWSPVPGVRTFRIRYRQFDALGVGQDPVVRFATGRRLVITAPRARTSIFITPLAWDGVTEGPSVRLVAKLRA